MTTIRDLTVPARARRLLAQLALRAALACPPDGLEAPGRHGTNVRLLGTQAKERRTNERR